MTEPRGPRFAQLHLLTFYAPANLNRDDTGRPKTAVVGGVDRLRVSSQSLKRAVRTSDVFRDVLDAPMAERSRNFGRARVLVTLEEEGVDAETAEAAVEAVMKLFTAGKGDAGAAKGDDKGGKDKLQSGQLLFLSPEDVAAVTDLARRQAGGDTIARKDLEAALPTATSAADLAMFGRMVSGLSSRSMEAAVQVAHAITTHAASVEADMFSAVDDIPTGEDAGAGHYDSIGVGFGSGVFYLYACVDRHLLTENLGGDAALADRAVEALAHALATVSPRGKQATFASRARASLVLAERGDQQPRQLSSAFLRPAEPTPDAPDAMETAAGALLRTRADMDRAYGACADAARLLWVPAALPEGADAPPRADTLAALAAFAARG